MKITDKIDARTITGKALQLLRTQTIRLLQTGKTQDEVAGLTGVSRFTVGKWWRAYQADPETGLKVKKRGRQKGADCTLNETQAKEIQKLICDKSPDQLKLAFALWTRKAVQGLILQRFQIVMPIRTVGDYLQRWGFTPQKPAKRAYEQQPAAVKKWLDEEYPAIASKAKEEQADIYWGDETGVRNDCQHGRSYAPKGKTPVLRLPAKRISLNMISALTNQGKVRFMIYKENMTAQVLITFMQRLVKDAPRKVFLILDNLKVHHAKLVQEWLAEHREQIEVFYLPSYSPELNPDEYLNCDLKDGVHSAPPTRTENTLREKVTSHMRKLQKLPERIVKYFKHPSIAYAA
jgi:transposase